MRARPALCLVLAALLLLAPAALASPPQALDLFRQAAFSPEYGAQGPEALRRWAGPVILWMGGEATPEDERTLDRFILQLNERVPGLPAVCRITVREKANVTLVLAPLERLHEHVDSYVDGNWGFVSFWWNDAQEMVSAQIAVASDVTSQEERSHLILEELVGALGLTNDIQDPPDSIIYQQWTAVQQLSELDWQLLNLLYDPRLSPGMGPEEALAALGA